MNKISHKYTFLTIGLALTIFSVYFFALAKMESDLQLAQISTVKAHNKLADYQQTMRTIDGYLRRKRAMQSQRDVLTARLYNKKEVLALVKHLKTNAQQRDLRLKEISPSISELLALNALPPEDGSPRYLDIAMRYTGSFRDAAAFLERLEDEPMFVELLSFNIISREGGLRPAEYRIRFSSIIGGSGINSSETKKPMVAEDAQMTGATNE